MFMCPKFCTNPASKYRIPALNIFANLLLFESYVGHISKNYLPLMQQVAGSLAKIGFVETLTLGMPASQSWP